MSDKVLILVATMSGTAEMVADEVSDRLDENGVESKVVRMEKASVAMVAAAKRIIVCTSTYGTGDVPDNGQALYEGLSVQKPDLSHLTYGVISLGDSVYPQTYCFGGKKFDELFAALGATRVGERFEHDRRGLIYPEEAAADWAEEWAAQLN